MSSVESGVSHRDRGVRTRSRPGGSARSSSWTPCSTGSTPTTRGCTPSPRSTTTTRGPLPRRRTRRFARATASAPGTACPIALKDIIDIEGRVTTGGSKHWENRVSPTTATLAAPADRGRDDRHRQGQHRRVRHGRLGHQPAHGDAAQPVGPRGSPRTRRLQQRLRRLRRRTPRALGHRHRHRRLRAHSLRLVRARRPQGDHRAGQHRGRGCRSRTRSTRPAP